MHSSPPKTPPKGLERAATDLILPPAASPLDYALIVGVALLPIFHLTLKSWTNGWLTVLGVLSLILISTEIKKGVRIFQNWQSKAIVACLLAPLLGVILAQLARHHWFWKAQDGPSRLVLAALAFLALRHRCISFYQYFRWGCPLSVIACFISMLLHKTPTAMWGGRFATYFVDCDAFGQHIVFLTFSAFIMAQMDESPSLLRKLLDYIAVGCGAYLAMGSLTRGAWIAIVPLSLVWVVALRSRPKKIVATALIAATAFGLILALKPDIQDRLLSIYQHLAQWFSGKNQDTSAGIRLSMWKITWALFKNNPAFGYGEYEDFKPYLDQPFITSIASEVARDTLTHGPHNQLAAEVLRSGILGFIYALGYFIVPGFVFVSGTRSTDHRTRQAAVLGLVVVVSFAVFSLSMEVFNLKFAVSFFGFLVAGLAADCLMTPRPAFTREEGQNPNGKLTDDHPLR